jgi:glycosyltransferase involved in cell wall biosynthesis
MTHSSHSDLLRAQPPAPGALDGLTIVLACLDQAENLPGALRRATEAAERCATVHEIVVVDEGSTDETAAIAGAVAERDPRVRLVIHADHRGYGDALRSGVAAARMPWVLLTDADLQLDLADLEGFLPLTASADLVVGWRVLPQGSVGARAEAAVWNRFVRAALGLQIRDVDCAFCLARRELLSGMDLGAGGALVGAELLVKSHVAGARTAEAPVRHHRVRAAGRHTGAGRRLSTRTLRELVDLRRALRDGSAPPAGA